MVAVAPSQNWAFSSQAYLCAHSNNQQFTPGNVQPWGSGSGPVVQPASVSITSTGYTEPVLFTVNTSTTPNVLTTFGQNQAIINNVAIGPILPNGGGTLTALVTAAAPSGSAISAYAVFVTAGDVGADSSDGFPNGDGGNIPFHLEFNGVSVPNGYPSLIKVVAGTTNDLPTQTTYSMYAVFAYNYLASGCAVMYDAIYLPWGLGPYPAWYYNGSGNGNPQFGGQVEINFQTPLTPNTTQIVSVQFDFSFQDSVQLYYVNPNTRSLIALTVLSGSNAATTITFTTDANNNLSATHT